jgi:cytosine/adenosine deaminase-related metal-dependent hydrolase
MDGPPLENGAVVVDGELVVAVGTFAEMRSAHHGEVVDLGDRILLPGLVNAHCHLDYTCLRGKIPRQVSFTEWIRAINAAKARLTQADYIESINRGFLEARRFGTTSMLNLTAFPELMPLVRPVLRTGWMAELIDVRAPGETTALVNSARESLAKAPGSGLAPHAPYTASPALYHECQDRPLPLTTHLAESREEMSMFRDGSGALSDFMGSINPNFDSGGQRDEGLERAPQQPAPHLSTPRGVARPGGRPSIRAGRATPIPAGCARW